MSLGSSVEQFVPVIAIISVFGFLTISAISHYAYKAYRCSVLTRLKERLLESGMSSGEIERVINAGHSQDINDGVCRKKSA